MRARIARLGVLTAGLFGLTATTIPSASATTIKEIVFTGTARVPGGLGYPGFGTGGLDPNKIPCTDALLLDPTCVTVKIGPKGEPQFNFTPEGNHSSFNFTSAGCVKATVSTDVAKKTPGLQTCVMWAAGAWWGYCGLSTGVGVIWIDDITPVTVLGTKQSQSIGIKFTEVGGVMYLTGGDLQTNIYGIVNAVPVTGSCTNKGATGFQLMGVATYKDCTTSIPPVC